MNRKVAALITFLSAISFANAKDPNPESLRTPPEQLTRAKNLIRLLSVTSYPERERATRELQSMGRSARQALEEGARDPDAEVSYRCRTLLPEADADDFRIRSELFMADLNCDFDHGLPGWRKFRFVAGDTRASRQMFIEMSKNPRNRELLTAVQGISHDTSQTLSGIAGPAAMLGADRSKAFDDLVSDRRAEMAHDMMMKQMRGDPNLGLTVPDILLQMFLDGQSTSAIQQGPWTFFNILQQQPNLSVAIAKDQSPARRIAMNWLMTRADTDLTNIQAYGLIDQWTTPKDVQGKLYTKIYANKATQIDQRAAALCRVAQLSGVESLPLLISAFQDDSVLPMFAPGGGDFEMKDVALGLAVAVTNQDHKNYGMPFTGLRPKAPLPTPLGMVNFTMFRYSGAGKEFEAKRDKAFAAWREWETQLHGACSGMSVAIPAVNKKIPIEKAKAE